MGQAGILGTTFKETVTFRAQQVLTLHLHGPENGASLNIAFWVPPPPSCSLLPSQHISDLCRAAREARSALKRESWEGTICFV